MATFNIGDGSLSMNVHYVRIETPNKLSLIRAVRTVTGCGLKDAKDAVEGILRSIDVTIESNERCHLPQCLVETHRHVLSFNLDHYYGSLAEVIERPQREPEDYFTNALS